MIGHILQSSCIFLSSIWKNSRKHCAWSLVYIWFIWILSTIKIFICSLVTIRLDWKSEPKSFSFSFTTVWTNLWVRCNMSSLLRQVRTVSDNDSSFAAVRTSFTRVIEWAMVRLSAMSRILVKLTKNTNFFNLHDCRFYSYKRNVKKRKIRSVHWSINGSNSPYSSVNATLHVPNPKIAFNCGEALGRVIDTPSITKYFITRLDWRCVAGLHSALLLLHTSGAKQASVFGPSTLKHFCDKILCNVPKDELDVTAVNCDNGHIHICNDNALRIRAIPLRNASEQYARVFAYAGEIEEYRGGINIEKCVSLDVPAGPMISQLSKGLDITLYNGTVIRKADVSEYYPKLDFLGKIKTKFEWIRLHEFVFQLLTSPTSNICIIWRAQRFFWTITRQKIQFFIFHRRI